MPELIFKWNGTRPDFPRFDFPIQLAVQGFRGALEMPHVLHARDRERQIILDEALFFARPKAGENQNAFADARFAKLDSLVRAGDAKPFDAGLLQRFRNRHRAKAVRIRFYDREDFRLRADVRPNHLKIFQDRFERNLRPYGAASEMYGLGHGLLECQSQPQWRDENSCLDVSTHRLGKHRIQEDCS